MDQQTLKNILVFLQQGRYDLSANGSAALLETIHKVSEMITQGEKMEEVKPEE